MAALCLLYAGLSGCSAAVATPPTHAGAASATRSWYEADDTVSLAMRRVADQLVGVGMKPSPIALRGFVAAGARRSHPFTLPKNTCATLVAVASRGIADIDAALYTPEGELLAADAQPDSHPTIQVCAAEESRELYYAMHAYEGAGTFLMVAFVGPPESFEAAAQVLGGQPAVARASPAEADMLGRISAFTQGVRRRGFAAETPPLRVPVEQGQRVRVGVEVAAGACYTAAGFALDGLEDLNLRVLDDEGLELRRDVEPLGDAALQFCARRAGDYAVEVHGARGAGVALMMLYRGDSAELGGEQGLWLGRPPGLIAQQPALEESVEALLEQARRDGYGAPNARQEARISQAESRHHRLEAPAASCLRVAVQGGQGVGELQLSVHTSAGTLAQSRSTDGNAVTHLCNVTEDLDVRVTSLSGQGRYAVLAWPLPIGAERDASAQRQSAKLTAQRDGFVHHPDFAHGARSIRVKGERTVGLLLSAGRCMRAYVHGPGDLQASLREGTRLLAKEDAGAEPLQLCAGDAGARSLTLELRANDAQAWLHVYDKAVPKSHARFK